MRKYAFSYATLLVAIILIGVFLVLAINTLRFIKDDHGNIISTKNGRFSNEYNRIDNGGDQVMIWENQDVTPKGKFLITGATCPEIFHFSPGDTNPCSNDEKFLFDKGFDNEKVNGHADTVKIELFAGADDKVQKIYQDGHFLVVEERKK